MRDLSSMFVIRLCSIVSKDMFGQRLIYRAYSH